MKLKLIFHSIDVPLSDLKKNSSNIDPKTRKRVYPLIVRFDIGNVFIGEQVVMVDEINKKYEDFKNGIFQTYSERDFDNIIIEDTSKVTYLDVSHIAIFSNKLVDRAVPNFTSCMFATYTKCNYNNWVDTNKLFYRIIEDDDKETSTEKFYKEKFKEYRQKIDETFSLLNYKEMLYCLFVLSDEKYYKMTLDITKEALEDDKISLEDKKGILRCFISTSNFYYEPYDACGFTGMGHLVRGIYKKGFVNIAEEIYELVRKFIFDNNLTDEFTKELMDYHKKSWTIKGIPENFASEYKYNKYCMKKRFDELYNYLSLTEFELHNDIIRCLIDISEKEYYIKYVDFIKRINIKEMSRDIYCNLFYLIGERCMKNGKSTLYKTYNSDFSFTYGLLGVAKHRGFDDVAVDIYDIVVDIYYKFKDDILEKSQGMFNDEYLFEVLEFLESHDKIYHESEETWIKMG